MTDSIDLESRDIQMLDELVGMLAAHGWDAEDICNRVTETYRQMEQLESPEEE